MSPSFLLTNALLCSVAAILLIPIMRDPKSLTYKNGFPLFVLGIFILIKLLFPYEFTFTKTLASKVILPALDMIGNYRLFGVITVFRLFLVGWLSVSSLLFLHIFRNHRKLVGVLSVVPSTNDSKINDLIIELCIQKKLKRMPKVILLDIQTSPFIVGFKKSTIVLPINLTDEAYKFILLHELEHVKHRHVYIKTFVEMVSILYWWNPVVWFIRREIIRALEIHSDSNVMQFLDDSTKIDYLNAIITLTRKFSNQSSSSLALTFALNDSFVGYRIKTALALANVTKSNRLFFKTASAILISISFFVGSFLYTFEVSRYTPEKLVGTFLLDSKTDYFMKNSYQNYDLYVDEVYKITLPSIPNDLSFLPVRQSPEAHY
jgi:beta-lactamase regulating signal transducer with metallopeptidase domain